LVGRCCQGQSDPWRHGLQAAPETAALSQIANSESRRSDRNDPVVDRVAVEIQDPALDTGTAVEG
jgi:hypothetical protein